MPTKMAGNKDSASSPPDACSNTTRLQRNLAEKQRRDKLNGYISELATIVPMVSMASKRLDKTSILRLSAAHLRISQSFLTGTKKKTKNSFKWRPSFFTTEQVREILESVEGFLLVTSTNGKIIYISQSVEKFLGHQNIEMIGHSVFSFVHPSDAETVRTQLQTLNLAAGHKNGNSNYSTRCSFYCRLRERNQPRSEVLTYQFVHVIGHMTHAVPNTEEEEEEDEEDLDDIETSKESSSPNLILKAFVRVVYSNPYNELSLADAVEDEYVTRHSPDGTIVFADHRLATITGHLPHEVYGMSAYEYINADDIPVALFAHKLMFSNNGGTGLIVYRLRARNESFVFLKSTGHLQFEKSSSQVDHFVCVNKLLSEEEGETELKKFVDRFTPHIGDSSSLFESIRSIKGARPVKVEIKTSSESEAYVMDIDSNAITGFSENLSSTTEQSETNQQQIVSSVTSYSKKMNEKLSLETEINGRMSVNYSPLTESSLSANSPQSEDVASPKNLSFGQSTLFSTNETSSSELLASDLTAQKLEGLVGQDQLLCPTNLACASPLLSSLNQSSVDQVTLFLQSNSTPSPVSPLVINEDTTLTDPSLWNGSPSLNVLDCIDTLPTPPLSSEECSSKNERDQDMSC